MIFRNIQDQITPYLETRQVIAINGMRRTGKTTLIKHLLDNCPGSNKAFFDMERVENRYLFGDENYQNIVQFLEMEGIDFSKKVYLALDEIQLVKNITSLIKYLYDNNDIKFLVTGSSSFYMQNHFSESLAGRKFLFTLYTLSFDEFLRFKNFEISKPENSFQQLNPHFIRKYQLLYDEYLQYGGFPEVATISDVEVKKKYLSDILNSYLQLDIKFLADFSIADDIYKLLKLLSARVGSKIDYSKLSGISGIHRKKIKEYLHFLEQTFFIQLISPFVVNTDREIAHQKKLYFSDTGLLNSIGKVSSGALFENKIANQLSRKGSLKYYARRNGQEIDFILDDKIAIEVKETAIESDYKKLKERAHSIKLKEFYLVGKNLPQKDFTDFVWGGSII